MVFNIIGRNQDDHVKNTAFLMDKNGKWRLSPAYDFIYSYNPDGAWTSRHQITVNGKRDHFCRTDIEACAASADIPKCKVSEIIEQVNSAIRQWPEHAGKAGVDTETSKGILNALRFNAI